MPPPTLTFRPCSLARTHPPCPFNSSPLLLQPPGSTSRCRCPCCSPATSPASPSRVRLACREAAPFVWQPCVRACPAAARQALEEAHSSPPASPPCFRAPLSCPTFRRRHRRLLRQPLPRAARPLVPGRRLLPLYAGARAPGGQAARALAVWGRAHGADPGRGPAAVRGGVGEERRAQREDRGCWLA